MKRYLASAAILAATFSPHPAVSQGAPPAQAPLVFEVENYTTPTDGWLVNKLVENKWNLWSTDKDAEKKWSGGVVLQSPIVKQDRATPEEGAPPLHTRITGIPNGTYTVALRGVGRPLAVSLDGGKTWQRKTGGDRILGTFDITNGVFEVMADDRYAADPPGFSYYDALVFTRAIPTRMGIINGDFDFNAEAPDGWNFWSRTNSGSASMAAESRTGKAVRIQHDGDKDWAFSNSGRLSVKPGQVYTITAWIKGEGKAEVAVVAHGGGKLLTWSIGGDQTAAGAKWTKLEGEATVPDGCDQIYVRVVGSGKANLLLDDVALRAGGLPPSPPKPKVQGFARERVTEKIARGMLALPRAGNQVYLGWRLLADDPKDVAFNVYRRTGKGAPVRLNKEPISRTTDFVDAQAPAGEQQYFIRPIIAGKEGRESETVTATPSAQGQNYFSFKLQGDYTFQKVGIADLNGDGHYDYVIKQPNSNIDPYREYWQKSPDTYKLEAYRHDGTFLWRYDLGWAIERGIWYSPYVVADFDGDGKAEVAVKTGEGDPRDPDGHVTSGPEYLTILDGQTGKERTRVAWPSREGFSDYNLYCRNQLGVAYLDGKTPCIIVERGTYNTIKVVAFQFHGGKLKEMWNWDDKQDRGRYRGQGAHILHAADVDGDGRDEVIIGSAVLDDNGQGLWTVGLGHPDHVTVGDLDPTRPGLEIQYGIETRNPKNAICMVDARTGKFLWGLNEPSIHIHSSGLCADIDPAHPGVESYAGERDDKEKRWLYSAKGEVISNKDMGGLAPRAVYWDADLQRELLTGGKVRDFGGGQHEPAIAGSIIAVADILGDWREEIITSVAGEFRIYTTGIPAEDRRTCLMQDPIYRMCVVGATQGYYQIPSLSVLPSAAAAALAVSAPTDGLAPRGEASCTAVVAAPAGQPVRGTLRLTAQGATITPQQVAVDVPAGQTRQFPFTLRTAGPEETAAQALVRRAAGGLSQVKVSLAIPEASLRNESLLPIQELMLQGVPMAQAEEVSAQEGGTVQVREDKPGVSGKAVSHWDAAGHRISWKINVPKAGRYALAVRYSCPNDAQRELRIEGANPVAVTFAGSGGFGDRTTDWRHLIAFGADRKLLAFNLNAGACTVTLTNTDGRGVNLDYLALLPMD